MASKIVDKKNLKTKLDFIRENQEKIVFTNGCFDILHAGHVRYLKKAKSLGDILIIGINTDKSVSVLKGKNRPINSLEHRIEVLESISYIDYIISYDSETPENLLKIIKPDLLVKGGDYKDLKMVIGKDIVESYGGTVYLLDYIDGISSSIIINKLS
ncbi:D-glycero-beta-D-manno-heptose 1-phosphate adenylyltransferase [Gammaproteobacteria bacterium]|nr:D-glycero-beta-D-manno-heptose 1-phosphate adenylyltransferase [Gammaproteobacteria bacterium]